MTIRGCWSFVTAWPRGFVGWLHTSVCALTTEEGRKGWAMLAALGCCVIESTMLASVLWLVRTKPMLAFWIGLSAQGVNLIVVTGLMVLLGIKRSTHADANITGVGTVGVQVEDKD